MSNTTSTSTPQKVHFLILCHGMWGNPAHLQAMKDTMYQRFIKLSASDESGGEYEYIVHAAESNQEQNTYDGIDWGGERLVKEVSAAYSRSVPGCRLVTRFSITGYSLGGLLARYVVGALHAQGFFERVEPVNFNTIATPHLGIPRYPGFFSGVASVVGPRFLGRTGQQFYHVDKWSEDGRSLLEIMADPDSVFFAALKRFQNVMIFANTVNDTTVPYLSAAIETEDPFLERATTGLTVEFDPTYSPVITSYSTPSAPPPQPASPPASFPYIKIKKPFIPPPLRSRTMPWLDWVVVAAMPVLMPVFMGVALTKLGMDSRASGKRTKVLEMENEDDVEEAEVGKMVGASSATSLPSTRSSGSPEPSSSKSAPTPTTTPAANACKATPQLSAAQVKMAANLNSLPHLKKKLVYIISNPLNETAAHAHAVVVARDLTRFETHRAGLGVLRCWRDEFVL
ncbi:DUF676-domain-containing protein [Clavulina sp. PMI_390]|nr:DUF676-domain-containing protein [Clavulina sp. PMI_390]